MDRPLSSWRQPDSDEESPSEPVEQKEAPKADAAPHDDAAFACIRTTDGPAYIRKSSVVIFRLIEKRSQMHTCDNEYILDNVVLNGNGGLSSFEYKIPSEEDFNKYAEQMNS